MIVESLNESNAREWERFVAKSPRATFCHSLKWKAVLEKLFPVEPMYLLIRDCADNLVGVCPFVIWKELKVVRVLDSLLDSDYGGPVITEGYAEPTMKALRCYLEQLAHDRNITYARIRLSDRSYSQYLGGSVSRVDLSLGTMMLDLQEDPTEFIWDEVFTKKDGQRKYISRFERNAYRTREIDGCHEDWRNFYTLYYNNLVHIGGALPYDFDFFEDVRSLLYPDNFGVLLAEKDGRSMGALGFYKYEEACAIYLEYIGLDRNTENTFHVSYYLYWEALRWAERAGYRFVSFGATPSNPDDIHRRIKSKFGAKFNQDYIVYLVFDRRRFFLREKAAALWGKTSPMLPKRVSHKLLATAENR